MNLDYNILCLDDMPDWIKQKEDDIKGILENENFEFKEGTIEYVNSDNEFKNISSLYDDYDLILVDFDLSRTDLGKGGRSGIDIIQSIRDGDHYTDILFYSSKSHSDLRIEIANKNIEGVYCVSRDNHSFLEKLERIFLNSIKKVQNLNNLRGLVMAETSDLDILKQKIIKKIINGDSTKKIDLIKNIKNTIYKSIFTNLRKLKKYDSKSINKDKLNTILEDLQESDKIAFIKSKLDTFSSDDLSEEDLLILFNNEIDMYLIEEFFFDFDKKRHTIDKIINLFEIDKEFDKELYKEKIQDIRNDLAHKESRNGNPEKLVKGKSEVYENEKSIYFGETEFTKETCREIRKDIIIFKNLLTEIYDNLD
jgi:DNA-binding NarL/FixJ family response regulator